MTPERRPDEVDDLIAQRAAEDPTEGLRRRVAALEDDVRRVTLARLHARRRAVRAIWWSLAALLLFAVTLPWFPGTETRPSRSFLTAFAEGELVVPVTLTVLIPALFIGVTAWRWPRVGGALLLLFAAYLGGVGYRSEAVVPQFGTILAACVLVVAGVLRLMSHERDDDVV